jgi:hypothetical protein
LSQLPNQFRWAAWAGQVLQRVPNPQECLTAIQQRQEAVDDDAGEAELVAGEFRDKLQATGFDPERDCVFIPSGKAADWLQAATKKHRATNRATAYLKDLRIPELSTTKKDGRPGWRWRGANAPAEATMSKLR